MKRGSLTAVASGFFVLFLSSFFYLDSFSVFFFLLLIFCLEIG